MTTPLPSPTPFAELLKRGTLGPFIVSGPTPGAAKRWFIESLDRTEGIIAEIRLTTSNSRGVAGHEANAELICRLLSWAHAGGVEELREVQGIMEYFVKEGHLFKKQNNQLRASLALLDGKKDGA